MSDMREAQAGAPQVPRQARGQERRGGTTRTTAWTGWVFFASMMMVMVGAFQAIVGLTALFDDGYYRVTSDGLLVHVDYTAWGWVHLALGVIAVAAGFGLMAGQMWARIVGVAMALVSAVVNLAFLNAYPFWAALVIALDVIVIYAITAHGREVRSAGR